MVFFCFILVLHYMVMQGSLRGATGMFPLAFVEIIEDLPADAPFEDWPQSSTAETAQTTHTHELPVVRK